MNRHDFLEEEGLLGKRRVVPGFKDFFQGAVLLEELGGGLGADPFEARDLVRAIAAQGFKVRNLFGEDSHSFDDLLRPNAIQIDSPLLRTEDENAVVDELERVFVGCEDQTLAATCQFKGRGRGNEVVGFVTRMLGRAESKGLTKLREHAELLLDLRVKHPATLVSRPKGVAIGRNSQGVPGNENGARLLFLKDEEQPVEEADDGVDGEAAFAGEGLGRRVVGPVGHVVAVDNEEWGRLGLHGSAFLDR